MTELLRVSRLGAFLVRVGHNVNYFYWSKKIYNESRNRKIPVAQVLREIFKVKKREARAYFSIGRPQRRSVKKFFIFATPRSGSTLLRDLLNSHPCIQCDNEVLAYRVFFPRLLVEGYASAAEKKIYGFKCFVHQCGFEQAVGQPRRLVEGLCSDGWQMISLKRNNLFRQVVSKYLALSTGAWNRFSAQAIREDKAIHIEVKRFLDLMRLYEVWRRAQDEIVSRIPHLPLEYGEDLLNRGCHQKTAEKIFAYLGASPNPVGTRMCKQMDRPLASLIANYQELCAAVKDTAYASFLNDERECAG